MAREKKTTAILTTEAAQWALAYDMARSMATMAEANQKAAKSALEAALGGADAGVWPGGSVTLAPRELPAVTDWESVAHEIALKYGVPGEAFDGIKREQTRPRWTAQPVLTVHLKKETTK